MRTNYFLSFAFVFLFIFSIGVVKGQFIVGDTIGENVTHNNFCDTVLPLLVKSYSVFDMDIDFDGFKDIRFRREHSSSPAFNSQSFTVQTLNNIQFVCLPGTNEADTLVAGSILDGSLNWNTTATSAILYYTFSMWVPPYTNTINGICRKDNLYIGFRKISGTDTIYGWYFFDNSSSFRIKSYAVYKTFRFSPLQFKAEVDAPNHVCFTWKPPAAFELIRYDNGVLAGGYTRVSELPFMVASRWPASLLPNCKERYLTRIGFYYESGTYTLKVWKGANADRLIVSQLITDYTLYSWNEFWLDTPVYIDGTEEIWFGFEVKNYTGNYPAGYDNLPAKVGYSDKLNLDGVWTNLGSHNWNLYACFTDESIGIPYMEMAKPSQRSGNETYSERVLKHVPATDYKSSVNEFIGYNIYGKKNTNEYQKLNLNPVTDTLFATEIIQTGAWSFYTKAVYADGESAPSNTDTIDITVSLEENERTPMVTIKPNPAKDILYIDSSSPITGVVVFNSGGLDWLNETYSGFETISIDLSAFEKGIYHVRVSTLAGVVYKKLIIL